MKKNTKKLDLDLDFLGEDDTLSSKKVSSKKNAGSGQKKEKNDDTSESWMKPLFIIVALLVFSSIIATLFSLDTSDSLEGEISTTNNISITSKETLEVVDTEDLVVTGEYICSRHHFNKATELEKDYSFLSDREDVLALSVDEITYLSDEIEYSSVNEYSPQWEIDDYNGKIDDLNEKKSKFKRDYTLFESQRENANLEIEKHNNYLIQYCTPNK